MKKSFILLIGFVFGLFSLNVFSAVSTQTGSGANWGGVPNTATALEPPESRKVYIPGRVTAQIAGSCLSTNTRWGGNPLQPTSTHIVLGIPVVDVSNVKKYLIFEIPTQIVGYYTAGTNHRAQVYEATAVSNSYRTTATSLAGHAYYMAKGGKRVSISFTPTVSLKDKDRTRSVIIRQRSRSGNALSALNVGQAAASASAFASYTPNPKELTQGSVNINLRVPVASGYDCNYYTSPLMVFFNKKLPNFTGLSTFPLVKESYVTWPEQKSSGYFVALDKNEDGKITKAFELFGNQGKGLVSEYANGFESLKVFDLNKDKQINKKDKVFSQLVLWKDTNGNGIGEKAEQIPLSQKIESISLNYEESKVLFGKRAKELQKSTFVFVDDKGKKKQGHIADIWFTPVPKSRVIEASEDGESKAKKEVLTAEIESVKEVQKKYSLMSKIKKWFSIR